MSNNTTFLTDNLYHYLQQVSLREPAVLKSLREKTATLSGARMQIAPEQGQFMALLIQIMQAKRALEIGVFTGYSSTVTALALPNDGTLDACDIDAEVTKLAQAAWSEAKVNHKIRLYIGPALTTLEQLIKQKGLGFYDFIFIDADKANYDAYYEYALQLVRTGGLILIDNTLWHGDVARPEIQDKTTNALRTLNEKLHKDERVRLSVVPIGDGLTILNKC